MWAYSEYAFAAHILTCVSIGVSASVWVAGCKIAWSVHVYKIFEIMVFRVDGHFMETCNDN